MRSYEEGITVADDILIYGEHDENVVFKIYRLQLATLFRTTLMIGPVLSKVQRACHGSSIGAPTSARPAANDSNSRLWLGGEN